MNKKIIKNTDTDIVQKDNRQSWQELEGDDFLQDFEIEDLEDEIEELTEELAQAYERDFSIISLTQKLEKLKSEGFFEKDLNELSEKLTARFLYLENNDPVIMELIKDLAELKALLGI